MKRVGAALIAAILASAALKARTEKPVDPIREEPPTPKALPPPMLFPAYDQRGPGISYPEQQQRRKKGKRKRGPHWNG